ncbi:MAG: signal peptidase II [Bacteroidota bacterium]
MNKISRISIILIVITLGIGCDQTTKNIAKGSLAYSRPISVLNGVIRFEYAENSGAFLSIGANLPDFMRYLLFVVFVAAALIVTLTFTINAQSINNRQLVGLSMITAGGIGNLIDRMSNNGAVVDFVSIGFGHLRTGIFNLADVAIMTGFFLVLIYSLKDVRAQQKS